jgi:predicted DNA-binding protein (MmcQ/YjbR family)
MGKNQDLIYKKVYKLLFFIIHIYTSLYVILYINKNIRESSMTFNDVKNYCLSKKGAHEDFPFDAVTLVFKTGSKMFGLINTTGLPISVNLKCDPVLAQDYRINYKSVEPGYHMNKKHWNTVIIDGDVPDDELKKMIDDSYELVVKSMSRKERESIE